MPASLNFLEGKRMPQSKQYCYILEREKKKNPCHVSKEIRKIYFSRQNHAPSSKNHRPYTDSIPVLGISCKFSFDKRAGVCA
jgi:hypothetical protein